MGERVEKIEVRHLWCDKDGAEIKDCNHERMAISLEGKIYQVDLCEKHYRELKLQLNPYLENATVADQHIAPEVKVVQNEVQLYREKNEKYPAWKIRQWLKQIPGVEVNKHGPIHPDLIKRFEEHFNVKL